MAGRNWTSKPRGAREATDVRRERLLAGNGSGRAGGRGTSFGRTLSSANFPESSFFPQKKSPRDARTLPRARLDRRFRQNRDVFYFHATTRDEIRNGPHVSSRFLPNRYRNREKFEVVTIFFFYRFDTKTVTISRFDRFRYRFGINSINYSSHWGYIIL